MKSSFQIILIAVFSVAIVAGVLFFALGGGGGSDKPENVVLWGTLSFSGIQPSLEKLNGSKQKVAVAYVEKRPENFEKDLIEALASGVGPDIFFLPSSLINRFSNKIYPIPFSSFSEENYRTRFQRELGSLLVSGDSILGLPFTIDPLVMYWNRDMFQSAGITSAPEYWDDLVKETPKLTEKDKNFNVKKAGAGLGEYRNVNNAKEILSSLFLQSGLKIVESGTDNYACSLDKTVPGKSSPAAAALSFYTSFADPEKSVYTWNRSLSSSFDMFIRSDLAVYFGYGSEYEKIKAGNPNLNFETAAVPQQKGVAIRTTFGQTYAVAISKQSKHIGAGFLAANLLTSPDILSELLSSSNLVPADNSLLQRVPTRVPNSTLYRSAAIARGWLDPNAVLSDNVFKRMVESVTSGVSESANALRSACAEITDLFSRADSPAN